MSNGGQDIQEVEWAALHDLIKEFLRRTRWVELLGDGDYFLLDENWGSYQHQLEISNLVLLKPHVIKSLQALLADFPDWEISVGIDVVTRYQEWPPMGIIVRNDQIIDGLQREYLPSEYRDMSYEGRTTRLGAMLRPEK
jgi:hypothetical protein